ncbi:hypothetical protein ACTA71_006709 [Dictyostelium dimigraforme]
MEKSIKELNDRLKRSKMDVLYFNIEKYETSKIEGTNEIITNQYKANLNLGKLNTTSDWFLDENEAKKQCANNMLNLFKTLPDEDSNELAEREPIFKKETILLFSVFWNVVLFINFIPNTRYILYPLLALIFGLLTIPFYLNHDRIILRCTGNRVVSRETISFDTYILPIKYLNTSDYMIERSRVQPNTANSFLATASKDIFLNLVDSYNNIYEDPHYKILEGCGLRVNLKNGIHYAIVTIIKKDGKVLTYTKDIDPAHLDKKDFPILRVTSKNGTHFIAEKFAKILDLFVRDHQINHFNQFQSNPTSQFQSNPTSQFQSNPTSQFQSNPTTLAHQLPLLPLHYEDLKQKSNINNDENIELKNVQNKISDEENKSEDWYDDDDDEEIIQN